MEKKGAKNQEMGSNEYLRNAEYKQTGDDGARKDSTSGSPLYNNQSATSLLQQQAPVLQWPDAPQPNLEHPLNKNSTDINERQTLFLNPQQPQQNPNNHHLHNGQSHLTVSEVPFWLPPYQPFAPIGITDSSWQASVLVGGASSGSGPISSLCYQGGYSYPVKFPGHWHPSSLWAQAQQSQPPYAFHYPIYAGGFNHSVPPPISDSSTSTQPHQIGSIQPPAKLSRKHQQMWKEQSAQNVHMRAAICRLEFEIAAYQSRLIKLEGEVWSLKAQRELAVTGSTGVNAGLDVQTSTRGRRKRSIAPIKELPPNVSKPKSRGRKPISCKIESPHKEVNSGKESTNKEENREATCHQMIGIVTTSIQEENCGKISNTWNGCSSELNGNQLKLSSNIQNPTLQNQLHQNNSGIQILGANPRAISEIKNGKEQNRKTAFSIPSQHIKGIDAKGTSASYTGMNNANHGWQSNILTEDCGRNMLNFRSHDFYDNSSIVRQEGKVLPEWSFFNQGASEEHDVVGSRKDEEEMQEDASSATDPTSPKAEGAFAPFENQLRPQGKGSQFPSRKARSDRVLADFPKHGSKLYDKIRIFLYLESSNSFIPRLPEPIEIEHEG
ncbi:uncharacterized protein LOC143851235 [Tasmannia lanceolata]|uniref:uncharacterized protein LOC143851235 n=1 Tax=Tasmannia lanceolata TaxID=3420 RepID=UPI0040628634